MLAQDLIEITQSKGQLIEYVYKYLKRINRSSNRRLSTSVLYLKRGRSRALQAGERYATTRACSGDDQTRERVRGSEAKEQNCCTRAFTVQASIYKSTNIEARVH